MSDWVSAIDEASGAIYYTNTVTFESSWTMPEGYLEPVEGATAAVSPSSVSSMWIEKIDESSGAIYYQNEITGESQWEQPAGWIRPVSINPDEVASNWSTETDPSSGALYYLNSVTGLSTWVMPECMLTAELSAMGVQEEQKPPSRRKSSIINYPSPLTTKAVEITPPEPEPEPEPVVVTETPAPVEVTTSAPIIQSASLPPPPSLQKTTPVPVPPPSKPAAPPPVVLVATSVEINEPVIAKGNLKADIDVPVPEPTVNTPKKFVMKDDMTDEQLVKMCEGHTMEDYGTKYFNLDRKGIFGKKTTIEKILNWKDELIKTSLKSLTPDLTAQAIQIYRNVTGYMGDRTTGKPPLEHVQKILKNMLLAPEELRDEVFCQVIKQTRGNPNPENAEKGWTLLLLCLSSFVPSQSLMLPLMTHCSTQLNNPRPYTAQLATMCLHYIPKMCRLGFRREIPSRMELEATSRADGCNVKIYFVDKKFVQISVNSWTTMSELTASISNYMGIDKQRAPAYGIFESNTKDEQRPLDPDERVLELVSGWERLYVDAMEDANKGADQKGEKIDINDKAERNQFFFLFKLVVFIDSAGSSTGSPIDVELEYVQAIEDVISAKYPCSEQDALTLAALQLQELHGNHPGGDMCDYVQFRLQRFVAKKFFEGNKAKEAELENTVMTLYSKLSGYSQAEARLSYLDYVRGWKIYGSTFFVAEPLNNKELPTHVVLAINNKGILVIDASNKEYVAEYDYANVVTWGNSASSFVVITGTPTRQVKLYFRTMQGKEINALLRGYHDLKETAK